MRTSIVRRITEWRVAALQTAERRRILHGSTCGSVWFEVDLVQIQSGPGYQSIAVVRRQTGHSVVQAYVEFTRLDEARARLRAIAQLADILNGEVVASFWIFGFVLDLIQAQLVQLTLDAFHWVREKRTRSGREERSVSLLWSD